MHDDHNSVRCTVCIYIFGIELTQKLQWTNVK